MKTKFMIVSAVGLLATGILVVSGVTFANNANFGKAGIHSGSKVEWSGSKMGIRFGSGNFMSGHNAIMPKFASSGDAQAYRTAIETAITNNDYTAYVAANTKYGITKYITQDQFTKLVTEMADHKKIDDALKNGDYATWKTLNVGKPILEKIDTEAKFQKLQEIETYRTKIQALNTELGIGGANSNHEGFGMGKEMGRGRGMGMEMGQRNSD